MAGLFDAGLTLDPSGNTPDPGSGRLTGPVPPGGSGCLYASLHGRRYPDRNPQHVVLQLPPGDSGLL